MIKVETLNFALALLAFCFFILVFYRQIQYADKEYRYKLAPEIEHSGNIGVEVTPEGWSPEVRELVINI